MVVHKRCVTSFQTGNYQRSEPPVSTKNHQYEKVNWIKLVALNLLIVLMIVSPFIPGPSNKVVQLFSVAGQLAGIGGLFLVPIGLAWTVIEIRKLRNQKNNHVNQKLHYRLAITATSLIGLIFLLPQSLSIQQKL